MDFDGNGGHGDSYTDIPTRPMRVKVLYTFDAENKTTCLARLPNTLNIPVVAIDEQAQVGVIELQQCLQTIVSASPEILSKLDTGDFTVYTFDYTEHDTPIVGQGRLSSHLAASLLEHEKAMITGRVCKNIPALFSSGVKETLEVKFRLTPLARPTHGETMSTVHALRNSSPATSAGFDPNAWNASFQQKTQQQQQADYFTFDPLAASDGNDAALLENMFGLEAGSTGPVGESQQAGVVGGPETPTDSAFDFNPAFTSQSHSAPGSRAASPIMRPGSSIHNEQLRHHSFSAQPMSFADQSRPGSRGSVRSEGAPSYHQRQGPVQVFHQQIQQPQTEVYYNEDGQARKRAKVTQTEFRGKSHFGARPSDLRVTAATASSMHMHRPIAKRPSAPGADLEPPPRVPTPVPQRTILPRPPRPIRPAGSRSMLRQASTADSEFMSDVEPMSDATNSPEGSSPGNSITGETPMDIPSSPPLVPGFNQPTPSSPSLPTLPPSRVADSGYMSGTVMESLEHEEDRSPDAEDLEIAARYRSRYQRQGTYIKDEGSVAGDTPAPSGPFSKSERGGGVNDLSPMENATSTDRNATSQGSRPPQATTLQRSATTGNIPSSKAQIDRRESMPEGSGSRRGSLILPSKPLPRASSQEQSSEQLKQSRQSLHRSHTDLYSDAGSPAFSDAESGRHRGSGRSGGRTGRRQVIEQRLRDAIARGESPIYCAHCGAIETPTWRKIYVKAVIGKPSRLDAAEGEGESIGIQVVETDENTGESTKFLIRKSMKKTKDSQPGPGFEDVTLCNPCGLWFNKFRSMRPEDRWHRKSTTDRKKSKKMEDGPTTDGVEPQSEAFFTDQVMPEDAIDSSNSTDDAQDGAAQEVRPAPRPRPRANSMQPQPTHANSADYAARSHRAAGLRREVQSSPVPFRGSEQEPIELDLTPKPTRRLLFPSPREGGESKSLEKPRRKGTASPVDGNDARSRAAVAAFQETTLMAFTDKENMVPPLDENDDLAHLFDGSPSAVFKTPLPKTPAKRTPKCQPSGFDNVLKTPTPSSRKRKALSPNQNAANNADMRPNDFMTSPASARYFLRSTPSRLERTPGGRSISGGSNRTVEASPFSRHLAQMLSDANGMGDGLLTSPSRQYDFSDLPTFTTPGKEVDWKGLDEMLSSEFANFDEASGAMWRG